MCLLSLRTRGKDYVWLWFESPLYIWSILTSQADLIFSKMTVDVEQMMDMIIFTYGSDFWPIL